MSLSGSQEMSTVRFQLEDIQGDTSTEQIDAQEDREIVGYHMSLGDVNAGNLDARVRAWVGTDPGEDAGSEDLGGKFLTEGFAYIQDDDTNGVGWVVHDLPSSSPEAPPVWDWNEDVTLTFEATDNANDTLCRPRLTVYYREV